MMGKPPSSSRHEGRGKPSTMSSVGRTSDDIPHIYHEMLAEAHLSNSGVQGDHRATKRRRLGGRKSNYDTERQLSQEPHNPRVSEDIKKPVQTLYDIDASDESEMEWEDVELTSGLPQPADEEPLQITFENHDSTGQQRAIPRRKPVTALEKKWRLDIHKAHVLCLLSHVQLRNFWCNDEQVQRTLKRILSKHAVMCLNPKENLPQFTRSTTFVDGLKQASEAFKRLFKITAPGMKRPYWLESEGLLQSSITVPDHTETLLSKDDFRRQAALLHGSRDLGAQLFCGLLRSVGVDTRLVCSIQPLPFAGVARGTPVPRPEREYIVLSGDETGVPMRDTRGHTPASPDKQDILPRRIRRLAHPQFSQSPLARPKPRHGISPACAFQESPYPVFWAEAFNKAMQKWVPVDAIVTNTVGKPLRFEPPGSDRHNNMSYVVAFEDDASARDVTRRYVKSFNSKTRKNRVEFTNDGEKWWTDTMQFFERPFVEDRDQVELGDLAAAAASEGMPRNVQDFKSHPIYALERHLRRNEAIYPRREIGKVGLSKSAVNKKSQPLESVYRRADVHIVKSADGWYRQGRMIKAGEQPLKRVPTFHNPGPSLGDDECDKQDHPKIPMYAAFQTDLYIPPPIIDKRIIKNAYGNVDIYTPNMVPAGGFHLKHPGAARAARILGIDYAEAVTGFEFKGRQGTAILEGIVAAVEYREALDVVLSCLEDEREQAERDRKARECLRMWRFFLIKLRVAERLKSYTFEGEESGDGELQPSDDFDISGGFISGNSERNSRETSGDMAITTDLANPDDVDPESSAGESTTSPTAAGLISHAPIPRTPSSQVKRRSHYTLIVVPKDRTSGAKPKSVVLEAEQVSPLQSTNVADHHDLAGQYPRHQMIPRSPGQIANECSGTPIDVNSPHGDQLTSVAESSRLPDLVHEDSASEIERGSMLSHDPEDDDAEPEWLLSD